MDLTTLVNQLPDTIQTLETEVSNAKAYAIASLVLLGYIALQVSRRRR